MVVDNLTKRYGKKTAVDGLKFAAWPGVVTGFLERNGSEMSTTMRLILGLRAPTHAFATNYGERYSTHKSAARDVRVFIEAPAVHAQSDACSNAAEG